ncbi:MAG TPA: hypothetical protein VF384_16695 [Planctomycetota bacterium]
MTGAPPIEQRWPLGVSAATAAILLAAMLFGAWQLCFLCDDAFITFRYVSNAHDGLGLVWNPPPFERVEGYTCFLWAMMLWTVWSWFGVEPPDSANVLSVLCGVLQFAVVVLAAHDIRHRDGRRIAPVVAWAAVAVVVGNRTFLQWLTGGLETALFNVGFVGWAVFAFRGAVSPRRDRWLMAWSVFAAVAALTRPDGMLLVAATLAAALLSCRTWGLRWRGLLAGLSPLATVAAHLIWRRAYYGEWVPNTYYAKVLDPWPEAGLRYLLCYAVEHGLWLWAPFAVAGAASICWRARHTLWRSVATNLAPLAVVASTIVQVGYYVLKVGGDHFEYRIFSHLVPLTTLATAAIAAKWSASARLPLAAVLVFGLASGAGWVHLALSHDMGSYGFHPLTPRVPAPLKPLSRWYDRHQSWLHMHFVCLRARQHAVALQRISAPLPARARTKFDPTDVPVHAAPAVGVVGWVLPDCAILDFHGLNDWVIARSPERGHPDVAPEHLMTSFRTADADRDGLLVESELRHALGLILGLEPGPWADPWIEQLLGVAAVERPDALTLDEAKWLSEIGLQRGGMAHERGPPPGYVEAFAPNVEVGGGVARITPRAEPLTASRVRSIEAAWRKWIRDGAPADHTPAAK